MITITISHGELADRLTILMIKDQKISDQSKLHWIQKELSVMERKWDRALDALEYPDQHQCKKLINQLMTVNMTLWHIEDDLRQLECEGMFDQHFVQLARSVYKNNDERFRLKQEINQFFKNEFEEQKSYNTKWSYY